MSQHMSEYTFGVATPSQIHGKTGLEIMRAMQHHELPAPPIAKTLNFWLVAADEGTVTFEGETSFDLLNPLGIVHGGWALALLDTVTGCAAHTTLGIGESYTSVECKGNFSRPIPHDLGKVRAVGQVITRGKKIITAEGKIFSMENKILAHGTATLIIL